MLNIPEGTYDRLSIKKWMEGKSDKLPSPESEVNKNAIWEIIDTNMSIDNITVCELADKLTNNKGYRKYVFYENSYLYIADQDLFVGIPFAFLGVGKFAFQSNLIKIITKLSKNFFTIGMNEEGATVNIFNTVVNFKLIPFQEIPRFYLRYSVIRKRWEGKEGDDAFTDKNTDAKKVVKLFGGNKKSPTHKLFIESDQKHTILCENGVLCQYREEVA